MRPTTWLEIRCLVPADEADPLIEELAHLTGLGVCTANLAVDTFAVETIQEPETVCLLGYLTDDRDPAPVLAALESLLAEIRRRTGREIPPPTGSTIREEDWANNWKAYFKTTRVGHHLVIKPSWEVCLRRDGDVVIELDPGMAFGTGTHPTTRLCLEALERYLGSDQAPPSVLDVGTGSGVLAIAAALLGGAPVVGIDIDPDAVAVAGHNAAKNGVEGRIACSTLPLDQVDGEFAVIVANILAEDLVRMRHQLAAHLAPAGMLILSGILREKEELVCNGFADTGLTLQATTQCDDWTCLAFCREG